MKEAIFTTKQRF